MFKPDRPIETTEGDLLGRAKFSQSFGRAILAYKEKDSIVTAIYGDWGSGKSSVINMTLEYIEEQAEEKKEDEKPIIVKFNPWNYSNQSHLIALFFRELSFALRRKDYGEKARDIGEKLEAYSSFFAPLALIPDVPVGMFSLLAQRVFSGAGKAAQTWGAAYSKDLDATRKELNKLLGEQKRKIVIVVDDIDRLNSDEIRQVFQFVKMLGDFPNTIYVLAFDRGVVMKALKKVQKGSGNDYLEKIVQFPVELPPIGIPDLEEILFSLLNEFIKEKWDEAYWDNIYHSGVRHYFKTIRDVNRYINTLKFSFGMVRDDVNPVDFIAITTLQVFEPDLYSGIRDNKDLFTGALSSSYYFDDAEKKQTLARCDELLKRAQHLEKEQLIDFLGGLFPELKSIYGKMDYEHDPIGTWRRESRICHPERFDMYFSLALPPGEIPKSEMTSVLDLGSDQEAFSKALGRLKDDGRIIRYLDLMKDYTNDYIKIKNIQNIVSVLMDIGGSFPESETDALGFGTQMRIRHIFRQLSMRLNTQEERFDLFKLAIEKAENSLYTIVDKIGVLSQEHGRLTSKSGEQLKPEEEREMNVEQLNELETLATEKITTWSDEGKLNKHPNLANILYSWQKWNRENPDVSKQFVQNLISTDEGLIDFITTFASQPTTHTIGRVDYVSHKSWRINLQNLGDFVLVEDIEPRIRKIHKSSDFNNLSDNQQELIQIFLDTFDGKVEG